MISGAVRAMRGAFHLAGACVTTTLGEPMGVVGTGDQPDVMDVSDAHARAGGAIITDATMSSRRPAAIRSGVRRCDLSESHGCGDGSSGACSVQVATR